MSATIIPFPKPKKEQVASYRIPLYGNDEVKLTILAINFFGDKITPSRMVPYATPDTLKLYSPSLVIACLRMAAQSDLFSAAGKKTFAKILLAVEKVKVS